MSETDPRIEAPRGRAALVALVLLAAFAALLLLGRTRASAGLLAAVIGSLVFFGAWLGWLFSRGRPLAVVAWLRVPHYVQGGVQLGVYAYWGWYWQDVPAQAPYIIGQILFLMLFELCFSWTKGRAYRLGFAAVPVVLSTNLFLWFVDDLYACQLAMVAGAFLSKEYLKWSRAGRRVHIFNPSALVLAVVAVVVVLGQWAGLTRSGDISVTLGYPPLAYENIWLAGLIVAAFVPVVLVTLGAAVTVLGLGLIWTAVTGTVHFVDTAIPIAVFLGMVLLATDPASTPRRASGRLIFGALYGASAFFLYDLLKWAGTPSAPVTHFDKLMFLPVLNLLVQRIDAVAGWIEHRLRRWPRFLGDGRLHLGLWIGTFLLIRPQLNDHPARKPAFWEFRCDAGEQFACDQLLDRYLVHCGRGVGAACQNAGAMHARRGNAEAAADLYGRACIAEVATACLALAGQFEAGSGVRRDVEKAHRLRARACPALPAACVAAARRLLRPGAGRDPQAAAPLLQAGCDAGAGVACANLAVMLQRGDGVPADPSRAERLRQKACDAGISAACGWKR